MPTARPRAAGFTLLEMIVVLVVLGLVLGIAVSHGPTRSHALDVRTTVAQVVQTLRQARGAAIAANLPVMVAINGEQRSLSVTGGAALHLPAAFTVTAASGLAGRPTAKLVGIRFDPNGSSSGGLVVLEEGGRRTQVAVDWLTGRVSTSHAP